MKTDRELYDEALAIIDDNLQVVEGIIGNRFATASLIVEFAKRQVNNLDIPVVSVPKGTLPYDLVGEINACPNCKDSSNLCEEHSF